MKPHEIIAAWRGLPAFGALARAAAALAREGHDPDAIRDQITHQFGPPPVAPTLLGLRDDPV